MNGKLPNETINKIVDLVVNQNKSIYSTAKELNISKVAVKNNLIKLGYNEFLSKKTKYNKKIINEYYNEMIKLEMSLTNYCKYKKINRALFSINLKNLLGIELQNDCNRKRINEKSFENLSDEEKKLLTGLDLC